jgi:predicted unusual protein kinase regulating ubiquinone biosynthesis (AarF/ABC1/UbiB family)
MFHADPHPANVIVQADNRIILVDFGACGHVATEKRHRFAEVFRCQGLRDISGMVKASMMLLEPLPRIDLNAFKKDLERVYFRAAAAQWSKNARWWERTSATLWLTLMKLSRKYKLPVNDGTVKGLRATLLYDTLALRLDNEMDTRGESQRFVRESIRLKGKLMRKRLRKRLTRGPQLEDYAKLDQLTQLGTSAVEQVQRLVDHPPFQFNYSIDKPVFAVITGVKVLTFLGTVLFTVTGLVAGYLLLRGQQVLVPVVLQQVIQNRAFQGLTCLAILVGARQVMFRLGDNDV